MVLSAVLPVVRAEAGEKAEAMFAGGCFWGVEAVFEHVRGVSRATSGYTGGIETVLVEYDASVVSYRQLLEVFFTVAHDPTSRDRQGPDAGPAYRAVVFFRDRGERQQIEEYLRSLRQRASTGARS